MTCAFPHCRHDAIVVYAAAGRDVPLCDKHWTKMAELDPPARKAKLASVRR